MQPVNAQVLLDLLHKPTDLLHVQNVNCQNGPPTKTLNELRSSILGLQRLTFREWMTPVAPDGSHLRRVPVTEETLAELLARGDLGALLETDEENAGKAKSSPAVVNVGGKLWVGSDPPNGLLIYTLVPE